MLFRFFIVAVTLASPATAFVFSESDQRAYCAAVAGPENFDIWQCIDKNRDEFRRAQIIADSAPSDLAANAIAFCERKWRLDWSMIRDCAEDQQVAALRVEKEASTGDAITKKVVEACLKRRWPDAVLVAACIPVVDAALRNQP